MPRPAGPAPPRPAARTSLLNNRVFQAPLLATSPVSLPGPSRLPGRFARDTQAPPCRRAPLRSSLGRAARPATRPCGAPRLLRERSRRRRAVSFTLQCLRDSTRALARRRSRLSLAL